MLSCRWSLAGGERHDSEASPEGWRQRPPGLARFFNLSNFSFCSPSCPLFLSLGPAAPFTSAPVFSLQNGVVHRDLKLENILLDDSCNIKVRLLPGGLIPRARTQGASGCSLETRRVWGVTSVQPQSSSSTSMYLSPATCQTAIFVLA